MPEQALYLKWRPSLFNEMVGQEHITRTLRNSLKTGRIRHAYLFSGPRGTGKTTTARLLAKAVNCQHPDPEVRPCDQCPACIAVNEGRYLDLIEIDAASHTGVDDVRDLRDRIAFSPGEGQFKVYIIDEVHRFSPSAFDALLKTLEEPPAHAMFVLATTDIDKVPQTIKSRCLQFEFRLFSVRELADRLALIADSERLNIERTALELIARHGNGSMRDSISLLDQIVADPEEVITLELVQNILGTGSRAAVRDLVSALVSQDSAEGLRIINTAIDSGTDPRQFAQQVVDHLRSVMIAQTAGVELLEASAEDMTMFQAQAAAFPRGALIHAIRVFNEAISASKGGWQPQLALELALVESTRAADEATTMVPAAVMRAAVQAAQPAAPAAEPAAPVEPSAPGAPPAVPLMKVRDEWISVQKAANQLDKSLPALMDHGKVMFIDGNKVVIGVQTDVFREKLDKKRAALDRALQAVFKVPLRTQIVLVSEQEGAPDESDKRQKLNEDDPVVAMGRQLNAQIRPDEANG